MGLMSVCNKAVITAATLWGATWTLIHCHYSNYDIVTQNQLKLHGSIIITVYHFWPHHLVLFCVLSHCKMTGMNPFGILYSFSIPKQQESQQVIQRY